jgi:integrase
MSKGSGVLITKRVVDSSRPTDKRYYVWDADLAGFGLRVEASGAKTFIVRYRADGGGRSAAQRFVTIGRFGALTAEQARKQAKTILGRRGLLATNPVAKASVRKTDNRRERFLTLEEVTRLGAAFDALEAEGANPKAVAIARLWVLTGCRRDEIAGLRWSEIDFERGLLILADSKTGKSIRPLGAAAIAILQAVKRNPESDFVFPAEFGDGHFLGTNRLWSKARDKAELPGATPHTLRHTMGSTAISMGEALALTGAILGHANPRSTAIYAHVQHDPSRRAADRVTKKIAAALAGKLGETTSQNI